MDTSPILIALTEARRLVRAARRDADDLRMRAWALRDDTQWRARAADEYRAVMTDLLAALDRLIASIDLTDDDLAAQYRTAAVDAGRWP